MRIERRLIRFDKLTPLASTHEHAETTNGLPPDASGKVFGTQFIRTRWRPAGLPGWLADHPVARRRRVCMRALLGGRGRNGAPDAEPFVQPLGGLLARRERYFIGRRRTRCGGRRVGCSGFNRGTRGLSLSVGVVVRVVDGNSWQGLGHRRAEPKGLRPKFGTADRRTFPGRRRGTLFAGRSDLETWRRNSTITAQNGVIVSSPSPRRRGI